MLTKFVKAVGIIGSVLTISNTFASSLHCAQEYIGFEQYGYVLFVGPTSQGGYYEVSCSNGDLHDTFSFYAKPRAAYIFPGNFHGHVTCTLTLTGAYSLSFSAECP